MSFAAPAGAYTRFMGRYSSQLGAGLVARLDPRAGQRALDVGCDPGLLAALLVDRLEASAVAAIDPSGPFVAAARRAPGSPLDDLDTSGRPDSSGGCNTS